MTSGSHSRPLAENSQPGMQPVERLADRLETPSLDDRTYRVIRLSNQLEALLVHDPETDKASAAMDVNVGAFSDEDDMPGMAHAVEHLLFMGTKKYPVENSYAQYLSANSGSSNAYTGATNTNYYFEVSAKPSNDEEPSASNPSALLGALDRFAQFFVEPLFLASTLDRELRAVDSENKKNLQSDQWRLHQLEKSLSNPKHPYCHFSTGNLEVLKTEPESRGINVREKFIEFYEKHYSANRMKLCVLGREPLDVLEAWVSEFFSNVKDKNLKPTRWTDEKPFNQEQLGIQCFAKPVMDSRELNFLFPFLDEEHLYESQPSRYISHLIGHEGPGSIMSYVKAKGWANGLSAGAYPVCPGSPSIFDCQVRLTEEGLKHYKEVVKVFFQYVALLRENPPQRWIFDEQKEMADVDFKFKQKTPASRFTSKISSVMQKPFPREWLLSGHSKLRKFDSAAIQAGLDCISPDNFRMTIVSRDYPGKWDKKERWYGTEYTCEKISAEFMAEIKKAAASSAKERIPQLHLPHKNHFIPTKLEVEKKDIKEPAPAPTIVRNDPMARTWYKKDDTFWVPKANLIVSCKSPLINDVPSNSVKARLFTDLVRDALEEYSYDADLAGLQYTVSTDSRGLFVEVSGYNDKLAVLLEQVLVTIRDHEIKDDRFAIIKERLTRGYRNWELQQPYTQIGELTTYLSYEHDTVVEELAAELPGITAEHVRQFRRDLLSQMHMECYVHGNLYKEDALKLTDMIESTLRARVLPRPQWPIQRCLLFPPGANYLWKKTLKDTANVNHCIEYFLFVGDKADRDLRAKVWLLDQVVHEPAFDILRTKEQLGYIVYSGIRANATTYGFRFIIQSEKTAPYLETRIEAFLSNFLLTLEKMTDAEFENHKRSLIVKRLEKPKYLDQETTRHWNQISSEWYDFESAQIDVAHIKPLTKADMISFFKQYIDPASAHRAKLCIYLIAQAKSDVSTKQISELVRTLDLDSTAAAQAATDLQARLSAAGHSEEKEIAGLKEYLVHDLTIADDKVDAAVKAWKTIHSAQYGDANGLHEDATPPSSNGTTPVLIKDVRAYKSGLLTGHLELQRQLTFITSSQKKRRITRQSTREQEPETASFSNSIAERILPSTEEDPDPAFSFSATSSTGLTTPAYVRGDSLPASGIPARLQSHQASFTTNDYASSTASSPCAASADFSIDNDRGDFDSLHPLVQRSTRSQSPFVLNTSHRAIMSEAADQAQRSSSPLKRRASSMDLEHDTTDGREDVDMLVLPDREHGQNAETEQDGSTSALKEETSEMPSLDEADPHTEPDIPPISDQIKTIETLVKAFAETPPQEGAETYLVSRRWLSKAMALGADGKHGTKDTTPMELGPVDNADIIETIFQDALGQKCVKLKPGTGTENFELFPKDAWDLLEKWHGMAVGQIPIVRTAHNTAPDSSSLPNIQFEFYPPVFVIYRVWSAISPIPIEQQIKVKKPAPPVVMQSSSAPFMPFLRKIKELTGVSMERKVRVWKVIQTLPTTAPSPPSGMKTPPHSPSGGASTVPQNLPIPPGSWPEMLVDTETFTKLESETERDKVDIQDETANPKYNGKRSLALVDLTVDQILVLDELVENTTWVTTYSSLVSGKTLASRSSGTSLSVQRGNGSGRASPAPQGPITRGRAQQKSGKTIGTTGLQNLGNTCYMNSALQCVRSVEELTKYFLTHEATKEINADNPLSHNGDVALAYGRLLADLYKDPPLNSVAPRHFKSVIGRYAPSFSGYGQQDSQEFLGFLLDGLQEDLSRIKKKPYIEKPDSTDDMINNPEKIREMAEKVWDITKKRDDSVIADLFTGMYQSTLECPVCEKISITFDPFNNLTLPLPMQNIWSRNVKYFPLNDAPVEIMVDLDKNSSIKALKQFISARVGVPTERLFGAEEFRDKFFKFYEDMASVSEEIQSSDHPVMFELEAAPTNVGAVKKDKKKANGVRSLLDEEQLDDVPEWEDPVAERLLVPVIHRLSPDDGSRNRFGRNKSEGEVPPPHFIVLTPDEARSEDMIRRKILEKIATYTTWSKLTVDEDSDNEGTTDPELVNTSSDADSSGDPKIIAKSVEGEEDIVDVSMTDASESKKPAPAVSAKQQSPTVLKRFKTKRPRWLDPKVFLDPSLQNLFEIGYFKENNSVLAVGWQNVQDETPFPRLSTRSPKPAPSDIEMRSPNAWDGSDESGSDELSQAPPSAVTRMNDEDSDESEEFPDIMSPRFPARPQPVHFKGNSVPVSARGKKKMKPSRTYGKKGKKRFEKQQRARQLHSQQMEIPETEDTGYDGGPLVRPGEGLVVDWPEDTWAAVFDGHSTSDMEGYRTFNELSTLPDPALEAKKKQRQQRRKHGCSLDDCLDEFAKEEILSEQDTWYCPRCKEHRRASKKFDLWKTPDILIVHLKRFSSSGWRRDKLDILVDFPIEKLDLSERVIDKKDGRQEIYDLIAVDDHWGGLGGGHYTAFAKNFVDGKWYEYNDASVSKLSDTGRVVGPAAYLLFYRRRSEAPLGGPRFQEIFDRYNQQNSDEEMNESGEDQRLGQGSSLRGSPSASTGAGLVLHQASPGLARGPQEEEDPFSNVMMHTGESGSPSYRPSLSHVGEGDEGVDAEPWGNDSTLHNSIEADDEGVGLPNYSNAGPPSSLSAIQGTWNFENLTGKPGSAIANDDDDDDEIGSNVAQNDNDSSTNEFIQANFNDIAMPSIELNIPGSVYMEPPEPEQPNYSDPAFEAPPADMMDELAKEIWDQKKRVHEVHAVVGPDEVSDKVAEIHVSDEEPAEDRSHS